MTLKELRERRAAVVKKMRRLSDAINGDEKRDFTDDEAQEWEDLDREYKRLSAQIQAAEGRERWDADERWSNNPDGRVGRDPVTDGERTYTADGVSRGGESQERFVDLRTGREVRVYGPQDRIARSRGDSEEDDEAGFGRCSLGRIVRAAALGDLSGLREAERRAIADGAAGGGVAVTEALSREVYDRARSYMRVVQAGTRTFVMEAGRQRVVKVTGDPTASFVVPGTAGGELSASEPSLGSTEYSGLTCATLFGLPIDTVEDASMVEPALEKAAAMALAGAWDLAALRGVAPIEPTGLRYVDGVNEINAGGNVNWDTISNALQDIEESNYTANAVILNPAMKYGLQRIKDGEGNYYIPRGELTNVRYLSTTQIGNAYGDGANESEIYAGQWNQLLWGIRTRLRLEVFRVGSDGTDEALTKMLVWIRLYSRGDIGPVAPAAFCRIIGITGVGSGV